MNPEAYNIELMQKMPFLGPLNIFKVKKYIGALKLIKTANL